MWMVLRTSKSVWSLGLGRVHRVPRNPMLNHICSRWKRIEQYGKYIPYQDNPTYFCWLMLVVYPYLIPLCPQCACFIFPCCFSHCWTLLTPLIPIRIGRACSWYLHGNHQKRPAFVDASGWVSQESDVRLIRFWKPLHVEKMWRNAKLYLIKTPAILWSLKTIQAIFEGTQKNFKVGWSREDPWTSTWSGYQKEPKQVGTRIARWAMKKKSKASFEDMKTQRNSDKYCCNSHKMSQIPGPYKPVPPPKCYVGF